MGNWYKDKLVGGIGYHQIDWIIRKVEIGYWLGESFQGKGLMTKACRTLITYAFAELGLNKVEIHCATENRRSCAIPKRLGFTQEGINDHFVTTPHSYKLRASGVTLVCRPIPSFVSTTEARPGSTQLLSRLARADVWYARAFTRGSLPRNLQTRFGCQCAKRTTAPFSLRVGKAESVFPPAGGRLFILLRERRAF